MTDYHVYRDLRDAKKIILAKPATFGRQKFYKGRAR